MTYFRSALKMGPLCCALLTVTLTGSSAIARAAEPTAGFQWVDRPDEGMSDLQYDGKPVLRYMYAFDRSTPKRAVETFKVYHHVFGPGTGDLITNGRISGPDSGGSLKVRRGVLIILIEAKHGADVQIGLEVIGVEFQFL